MLLNNMPKIDELEMIKSWRFVAEKSEKVNYFRLEMIF